MRQNVVAGLTPVGSKVEAKLTIGTLVSGKVIPAGAVLSGEVLASEPKTAAGPSRLAIRVDSARWKHDSVSVQAYLTPWYYPVRLTPGDDYPAEQRNRIHGDVGVTMGGSRPVEPISRPYPTATNPGADYPTAPNSTLSDHRVKMKDVDLIHMDGGGIAIISSHSNLKLDKTTTYVLATGDLPEIK